METAMARKMIDAEATVDRAKRNLTNAGAMHADDPKAVELLERAGDSYAVALFDRETVYREAMALAPMVEPVREAESPAEHAAASTD